MVNYQRCALFRDAHGRYFETTYAIFRGRNFRNNAHARYFENLRYQEVAYQQIGIIGPFFNKLLYKNLLLSDDEKLTNEALVTTNKRASLTSGRVKKTKKLNKRAMPSCRKKYFYRLLKYSGVLEWVGHC